MLIEVRDQEYLIGDLDADRSFDAGSYPDAFVDRISSQHRERALTSPVVLRAPRTLILSQTVDLPREAEADLNSAVRFGLTSWSPFEPSEVYFGACAKHSGRPDKIVAEIRYTLKTDVAGMIARCTDLGLAPDYIDLGTGAAWQISLDTEKLRMLRRTRRTDLGLVVAGLIGVLIVLGIVAYRQEQAIEVLRRQISMQLSERQSEAELLRKAESLEARNGLVRRQRAGQVDAFSFLSALATGLDDQAWFAELALTGQKGRATVVAPPDGDAIRRLEQTSFLADLRTLSVRPLSAVSRSYEIEFRLAREKP
ncbi:hypothetical protein SAMN05444161_4589 [Rhizobiales bacterium GAS191]|nr:hypothetical protein SAMN05444161_4589 [Rhizobiales bacterium GAS191]